MYFVSTLLCDSSFHRCGCARSRFASNFVASSKSDSGRRPKRTLDHGLLLKFLLYICGFSAAVVVISFQNIFLLFTKQNLEQSFVSRQDFLPSKRDDSDVWPQPREGGMNKECSWASAINLLISFRSAFPSSEAVLIKCFIFCKVFLVDLFSSTVDDVK